MGPLEKGTENNQPKRNTFYVTFFYSRNLEKLLAKRALRHLEETE